MKHTNSINKTFWIPVIILSFTGFLTGVLGFIEEGKNFLNSVYSTFQMFILHHSFEYKIESYLLECSRWIIFVVFLLITFQLFITIVAPQFLQYVKIRFFYKNHTVICGLNAVSMELINKLAGSKIIVIASEENQYAESLHQRKIKLIIGDPADEYILKIARIGKASYLYAVAGNDRENVKIAQSAFSMLENVQRTEPLKCNILVKDRELKILLGETALFKYKTGNFDGILFNVNEMGVKYSICMNIDKLLPENMKTSPEILIIGLTEKAENIILNLAHCLTMQRRIFHFTIVEEDETVINSFRKKYHYFWNFVKLEFAGEIEKICLGKTFDSILICTENQVEAIKEAVAIRYVLGKNTPNILVFCDEADTFNKVLNREGNLNERGEKEVFPLKDRNIFLINLFEEIAGYVFGFDKFIEEKAKMTHDFWNKLYGENREYDKMAGHFRQSSRNQILDNFLRTFIALGKSFNVAQECPVSFTDKDKETLAMMEHRRWVIEKYENGWRTGERIKPDQFKRHDCLVEWDKLPAIQKKKDIDAIDLMIYLLNNRENIN